MEQRNSLTDNIKTRSGEEVQVTVQDIANNPGVAPKQIAEVKSHYHFHKLSSVTLNHNTLICTFVPDPDPSSIFYTPLENNTSPVREYKINEEGDLSITPDGLAVRIGEKYISSEEIWDQPQL